MTDDPTDPKVTLEFIVVTPWDRRELPPGCEPGACVRCSRSVIISRTILAMAPPLPYVCIICWANDEADDENWVIPGPVLEAVSRAIGKRVTQDDVRTHLRRLKDLVAGGQGA